MDLPDHYWDNVFPLLVFFLIVLGIILILGLRSRIFFKMGLKNIGRRKTHTVIVIVGLLIGTAMISGALVTRDSMNYAWRIDTFRNTYYLDETVSATGGFFFNQSLYGSISSDPEVLKVTDAISPAIVFQGISVYNERTDKTKPESILIGFDPDLDSGFGKFDISSGDKYGADLAEDEAIINSILADEIDSKTGDTLEIYYTIPDPSVLYLPQDSGVSPPPENGNISPSEEFSFKRDILTIRFTVKAIAGGEGKSRMFGTPNVFILLDSAKDMYNASANEINMIKVSNKGGIVDSVEYSDEATSAIENVINEERWKDPENPLMWIMNVDEYKKAAVELSDFSSESLGSFLLMMAMFTVAAGILLIVNIFVMLAEERKTELGMSRALGLKRSHLSKMFLFEGLGYIIPASILGALLGLLVAYGLIFGFNRALELSEEEGIPFYFYPSSLVLAFCIGALISIGTIIFISNKLSKLNIVRAIRDMEEPIYKRATKAGLRNGIILIVLGIIGYFIGIGVEVGTLKFLGPNAVILGGAMLLRKYVRQEVAYTIAGILMFVFSLWALFYMEGGNSDEAMVMLVAMGLLLCFSIVMILVFNSKALVSGIGKLTSFQPQMKATAQPAIGYSMEKRFRTGMTIAMFSLILFMVTLFSIFSSSFITPDMRDERGGYDIYATSSIEIGDLNNISVKRDGQTEFLDSETLENDIEYVDAFKTVFFWGNLKKDGETVPTYGPPFYGVYGTEEDFGEHVEWKFETIHPDYNTSKEVWNALFIDDSLCIIDVSTASTYIPLQLDDKITLPQYVTNKSKEFRIIGIVQQTLLTGIFVGNQSMTINFPQSQGYNMYLIKVKDGVDPEDAAERLNTDFRVIGMNANSIEKILEELNKMMTSIMRMFNLFMALGLLIGVVSLGVIAYRAVHERKRAIGVMRAIGYKKSMIMNSFLTEILFITTMGVILGLTIGFIAGYGIWYIAMKDFDVPFIFPWGNLAEIVLAVYIASILCTIVPAYKASKIPPAEAIRHIG